MLREVHQLSQVRVRHVGLAPVRHPQVHVMTISDPTLFDGAPAPHARMTDPESSHLTLESLGKDTSYNWRIFAAIVKISQYGMRSVTDDDILDWMERRYQRRYQRNVIARQRGIIRELGWIQRVDDVEGPTGRPVVAHIPTERGLALWNSESSAPLVPPGVSS